MPIHEEYLTLSITWIKSLKDILFQQLDKSYWFQNKGDTNMVMYWFNYRNIKHC
jgi:hypothetical protein